MPGRQWGKSTDSCLWAGDPLEIPFLVYFGANIFDSSSYAHYANSKFYMTPYGAVNQLELLEQIGYVCNCPICSSHGAEENVMSNTENLSAIICGLFVML